MISQLAYEGWNSAKLRTVSVAKLTLGWEDDLFLVIINQLSQSGVTKWHVGLLIQQTIPDKCKCS